MKNNLKICFLTTYIPRECGIATFSNNLINAIKSADKNILIEVATINDKKYNYNQEVKYQIKQDKKNDYTKLALEINKSDIDTVIVEHEFGIFGGFNGRYLLDFLKNLKKPVVMTMHTVPIYQDKPFKIVPKRYLSRSKLLQKIFNYTDKITVMTKTSKKYLIDKFNFNKNNIEVIPHGAPLIDDITIRKYQNQKQEVGFSKDDFVLTSFGLIAPKKGLEYVIKAMPKIVAKYKNVKYLIAGKMHPKKPISYLNSLKKYTKNHSLENNIIFDNRYLTYDEIYRYLANTDIYITPYYAKEQSSSGTLSYAISSGRAIVSTPYIFATDIIKNYKVGELINFKDSESIRKVIIKMINNPKLVKNYQRNSRKFGKNIEWEKVAKQFINLCEK